MSKGEIADLTPLPTWVHRCGRLVFANEAFLAVLRAMGYVPAPFADFDLWRLVASESLTLAQANYHRIIASGRPLLHIPRTMVDARGQRRECTACVRPISWEGEAALLCQLTRFDADLTQAIDADCERANKLIATLTPRQRSVVCLISQGCSTTNIAAMLDISEATARTHVKHAMRRTGTHSRVELARLVLSSS